MSKLTIEQEALRRRTFAIIAHPDAGKTTLTEHILLAGGAIRAAGAVRARGENRRTQSDWMKIEKERGISVSASVMTFEHAGADGEAKMFNLLDTPGHEDFSEDTYRTLTAADCAIMVLDAAELVTGGYPAFDRQSFLEGHMTPVLWGSALRHFGIDELLAAIGDWAPPPKTMKARKEAPPETRNAPAPVDLTVEPGSAEVTGFVFKVQANMDPNHRDRIAMFRMASGSFKRGMKLKVQNTGKQLSVNAPIMFFASDRELAEDAFAGDVIGIPNHGVLRVGDSLSESGLIRFAGLPNFAPEILQRVRVKDPLKAKHLTKALEGLGEDGVTQLFRPEIGADFIVGAVGQLQFEVMADRLGEEYGLDCVFEPAPYAEARWVSPVEGATGADLEDFAGKYRGQMARDIDGEPVFLAKSSWETGYVGERFPKVAFSRTKERG